MLLILAPLSSNHSVYPSLSWEHAVTLICDATSDNSAVGGGDLVWEATVEFQVLDEEWLAEVQNS